MRILAIETVDRYGSVAALENDRLVAEIALDRQRRSAQALVPGMAEVLRQAAWQPRDVELLAVATGPGSFTGLRIGVTSAKTFAFATGCQILGVHSMTAIAARVPQEIGEFFVAIDAQRDELFVAEMRRDGDGNIAGSETTRVVPATEWLADLAANSWLTGPGLAKWQQGVRTDLRLVDPQLWFPTAEAVGQTAWRFYQGGQRHDAWNLVPLYVRRTAAEEKWEQRQLGVGEIGPASAQ